MMRIIALLLLLVWIPLAPGCGTRGEPSKATKDLLSEPLPEGDDLTDYIKHLRMRLSVAEEAREQERIDALQTKVWIGVGACVLAGVVFIALGIWTTRRILVEVGLFAFGLAALGSVVAWVVPYMLWIGIAVVVVGIGVAIYMLRNRDRSLTQVTAAVESAKKRIPAFKDAYKGIFREHIDEAMDDVVNLVRPREAS